MALQHISEVCTPPCAVVICSDSRSALSSIRSDSTSAREDLVLETAPTDHPRNGGPFPVCASTCLPLEPSGGQGSQEGSQVTGIPNPRTKTLISRHLLETAPTGVEETGRRLSSPGHCQRDGVFFPGPNHVLATHGLLADHVCA